MTAEGASSQGGHWGARSWQAVRRLSARTSLRTKLVTALLALVAIALAVMSFVGVAVFGDYLQSQVDVQLRSLDAQVQNDPAAFLGGHHMTFVLNNNVVEVLAPNGQPVTGLGNLQNLSIPGPAIPASRARELWSAVYRSGAVGRRQLAGHHPAGAVQHRGGVTTQSGTLVVGVSLGNLDQTMAYLIRLDVIVSVVILIVLMIVGFAVVRANLQPLVDIEETAGEIADGHLNRRVPELIRAPRSAASAGR